MSIIREEFASCPKECSIVVVVGAVLALLLHFDCLEVVVVCGFELWWCSGGP